MLGGVGADWSQMTAALSAGEGGGGPRAIRDAQEPARGGVSSRAATLDRMLAATKQTALNEPAKPAPAITATQAQGPLVPSAVESPGAVGPAKTTALEAEGAGVGRG